MRALPLLAALTVYCAPPATAAFTAAFTATVTAAGRPRALLVLHAACAAGDPGAFSEDRFRRHAEATGRSAALQHPFRLLSHVETCGPGWRATIAREALSTLSGGAPVALAGWAGAATCAALDASARALSRPRPAACAAGTARAAAAARVAARLRWARALVPPAPPGSECAATLADLRRDLVVAGVSVRAETLSKEELDRRPQVVIVCATVRVAELAALAAAERAARPVLLLLQEDASQLEPRRAAPGPVQTTEDALSKSNITLDLRKLPYEKKKGNLSSTLALPENANLSLFYPGMYKKSFPSPSTARFVNNAAAPYRNKRTRYGVGAAQSSTSKAVFPVERLVNTIKTDIVYDSLQNDSPIMDVVRDAKQTKAEKEFKDTRPAKPRGGRVRRAPLSDPSPADPIDSLETLAVKLNEVFGDQTILFSSRNLEIDPSSAPIVERAYDDVLDALQLDSTNVSAPISHKCFFLYELAQVGKSHWRRIAIITTVSNVSDSSGHWATTAELTNITSRFSRWSEERPPGPLEPASSVSVPVLVACLALALGAAAALALATRWAATRRRRRRRRGDAVLAPAEFAFPADERRRVGEGMETMLSCWLQQLHEFGGPELERPDLLKQPPRVATHAPSAPSSTCSINRVALDRRTRYKGDAVHMKYIPTNVALELKRKATDVLLVMQSLRHENLNPFIGCLCDLRPALVFDHCGRGSLEDVLMLDEIKLDWTFRLSLLTDLVKGMRYLHASPLRVHGRLTSRNCVVDSRWVLRVTDYGLPAFQRAQGLPQPTRTSRELLWTAPELLRESRGTGRGSQPGDVFSFAIVMQEVIVRGEPYCMLSLTPDELIEKVMRPPPLIRPSVSMGAAPPEAVSVMRQCWSEAPDLRPDFNRLLDIFRHLHKGRKINIVDTMFEMLEKYSNNLEDLIRERTEQLDMEKKKTEQLLNRMLPRSVAERLMLGSRVEPEEFEEVSIYFSDIVGFTALAARSTPVQVVDLLNDLYTTFDAAIEQYRVYKVETIGDAYMVVGGLPVRTRDHAESVATMALHLLHLAGRFRVRHLPATPLRLRIGLHTGPCCAAVVGLTMPRYCLFGDTVNTASRMESTGAAWRIQVSAATAERLAAAGGYRLRSRGLTQIKGKGAMHTYWLLGKEGFDKPLPVPPPLENGEEVLFETDGENESEPSSLTPVSPVRSTQTIERQRSDPCSTPDKFAWQRSGAMSADSSPPRVPRTPAADHSAPYARYKCLSGGARVLRRQWSLERGEAPAAAGEPPAPDAPPAALQPAARPPAPRYRTRPEPPPDATVSPDAHDAHDARDAHDATDAPEAAGGASAER